MRGIECRLRRPARLSRAAGRTRPLRRALVFCTHPNRASTEYEALRERIVWWDQKLAPTGDPCASFDLGHDRVVALPPKLAGDATGEASAYEARDHGGGAGGVSTARRCEGVPRRHTGPRRRPVDLALGEDADVARMCARAARRSGEDRPVEEGEVRLSRMADLASGDHRPFDRAADRDEIAKATWGHLEAHARGVDERVESPAERKVIAHLADAGHRHAVVERDDERRNVLERDASHPLALATWPRCHAARRRIEPNDRTLAQETDLERDGHEGDHAVAAHRAPALVVHEQDAGVAVGRHGLSGDCSIHVGVSARLEYQSAAQSVQPFPGKTPLFEDRRARDGVEAARHDPKRLPRGLRLPGEHAPPRGRRPPGLSTVGGEGHERARRYESQG